MPGTGRGIRRYTCARRWIYTCVYIAATRKWDRGGATREKERDGEQQAGVVDERAGREEQNDGGARAADTGWNEGEGWGYGGGAREPRAHINLLNRTSASRRISFVRALHLPAR